MRKRSMVPLPVYKSSAGSLQKSQWRVIDPGALSPWNVMSWGIRQLKGFVVGSEASESAPRLQIQELVLVENLQVWISVRTRKQGHFLSGCSSSDHLRALQQEAADLVVKKATGHNSSKMDLIYSKESFVEDFATILHDVTELSDADFDVLLLYLSRDSGSIAYDGKVCRGTMHGHVDR